ISDDVSSPPPSQTGCGSEGEGLAVGKRQAPTDYARSVGRTPPPRDRGEAHPDRVLYLRNVAIPLRSGPRWPGRPTVRRAEGLSGDGMTQEAKAGTPKGTGKPTPVTAASVWWCRITARIRTLGGSARKSADVRRVSLRRLDDQ